MGAITVGESFLLDFMRLLITKTVSHLIARLDVSLALERCSSLRGQQLSLVLCIRGIHDSQ